MKFVVPGKIYGKARAITVTNKYTGKVNSFTPSNTVHYEDLIRWCYTKSNPVNFEDKPVSITIYCYYQIPKSYTKKQKQECYEKHSYPKKKPDWDNIGKIVCDALNGLAYSDDKNVVDGIVRKRWSGGEEYITIEINSI